MNEEIIEPPEHATIIECWNCGQHYDDRYHVCCPYCGIGSGDEAE
jgi:hypothetical protein